MANRHPLKNSPPELTVYRAGSEEMSAAFAIVEEYNRAIGVVVRDTAESFARYFGEGGGVWLAAVAHQVVGCVALRSLPGRDGSGEVKRLYVRPEFRGTGIADALLHALEEYAREAGYRELYLDTKDDLQAAVRFYLRHDYEFCERYNDNPQATIFMRKQISGAGEAAAQEQV